jgi:hypothetical protein
MEQPMKFHASDMQISSAGGEYFQVSLSTSNDEHGPYVLLQNRFEFSRGPAYFECHNYDWAGHGRIKFYKLRNASLEIDVTDSAEHVTVLFNESDEKVGNLVWMLGIIFTEHVSFLSSSGIPEILIEEERF